MGNFLRGKERELQEQCKKQEERVKSLERGLKLLEDDNRKLHQDARQKDSTISKLEERISNAQVVAMEEKRNKGGTYISLHFVFVRF